MAHDWIPIRTDLSKSREVIAISNQTKMSRREVVGTLIDFWSWAQDETADGEIVDVTVDALVAALNIPILFFTSLINVGWLQEKRGNRPSLVIPNFQHWLSNGAKERISKTKRQRAWRDNASSLVDAIVDGNVDPKNTTPVLYCILDILNKKKEIKDPLICWINYRRSIRKPLSLTSVKSIIDRYGSRPADLAAAVDHSISNGWQGLFEPAKKRAAYGNATEDNLELIARLEREAHQ